MASSETPSFDEAEKADEPMRQIEGAESISRSDSGDATSAKTDPLESLADAVVSEKDEASLSLVILRDVAVVAALLSLFAAAEAWSAQSGLLFATALSLVDGLLVGAATAAMLHEWGHFIGARLGGGHAPLKPIGGFLPLFDFDYANNDARAFDWMSIGGNAGDIGVVVLFLLALPHDSVGTTALIAGAFGFAVFAGAIEFPVIRKARGGLSSLEALGTIPRDFFRRYARWGVGAAVAALILL